MDILALACCLLIFTFLLVTVMVCLCRGEQRNHRAQEQRRLEAIMAKIRKERDHDQPLPPAA